MGKEIFCHALHLCKLAKTWFFASQNMQYWCTPAHKKVVSFQFAEVASIIKIQGPHWNWGTDYCIGDVSQTRVKYDFTMFIICFLDEVTLSGRTNGQLAKINEPLLDNWLCMNEDQYT